MLSIPLLGVLALAPTLPQDPVKTAKPVEAVVKPLSDSLRGVAAYSGATILGDGSVIMILDPNGLAGEIVSAMLVFRRQRR